jgi:hypothetical protein
MPELKQQPTELIEAYSTARATGNQLLIRNAAGSLVSFLEEVEISKPGLVTESAIERADGGQE